MKPTETEPVGPATVAADERLNLIESLNQLYTRNVKRFAEFQKKAVDLAAEQNAEIDQHLEETRENIAVRSRDA